MPNVWAVWAMLMSYVGMDAEGIWASCPRALVAETLGIEERQVRHSVDALKRKRLISVAAGGHNGRASVYRLNIGDVRPDSHPTPKGSAPDANPIEPDAYPTAPNTYPTAPETYPTREVGGGEPLERLEYLPYGKCRVGVRNPPLKKNQNDSSYRNRFDRQGFGPMGDIAPVAPIEPHVLRPLEFRNDEGLLDALSREGGVHVE